MKIIPGLLLSGLTMLIFVSAARAEIACQPAALAASLDLETDLIGRV